MYKKLVLATIVVAFAAVQLANSLDCYTCTNAGSCNSAAKRTCDGNAANSTRTELQKYFLNIQPVNTTNYDCGIVHYKDAANRTAVEIRGCIHRDQLGTCNLASANATFTKQECRSCSGNLCNGRSPASAITANSFTMISAVLSVILAKVFVM